jgi:hypothetical protein
MEISNLVFYFTLDFLSADIELFKSWDVSQEILNFKWQKYKFSIIRCLEQNDNGYNGKKKSKKVKDGWKKKEKD